MEEINEWQQIEQHTPLESSGVYDGGDRSSSSSSTPTHHEEDGSSLSDREASTPVDWANEGKKLLKLRFEAMRVKIVRVASKVRNCATCAGAFWSVTCVAGAAAAAAVLVWLVYFGIQRRRRKVDGLNDLLRQKDEKISQLLLHIAHLDESLSSRRRVHVYRIAG
ncbi:uncharacterized protein LOC127106080 [Lathyrus oleraceus]|uniref:Transmembrane protein n=1 Tax=Pisum sativum TaxID=3888 RepID=A0A9D4VQ57_PEA|nr:uncharacterized protein LOC127106080 [Pisum sativum]KAI5387377.1 hypothetical protein KIW84_073489 [Pisum sativum]